MPTGVALALEELRQGTLYHRVGADDGYCGCRLVLSHLLSVSPLAYEKRAGALRPRPPPGSPYRRRDIRVPWRMTIWGAEAQPLKQRKVYITKRAGSCRRRLPVC